MPRNMACGIFIEAGHKLKYALIVEVIILVIFSGGSSKAAIVSIRGRQYAETA